MLWEETWYASRQGKPPEKGDTEPNAQLTYGWWLRLAMQVTPCPPDCDKTPPHVHVTPERIKELVAKSKDYARFRRMLDDTLGNDQ